MLTELVRDRTLHNNIWRNVQVGEHTGSLHCLLPGGTDAHRARERQDITQ